MQLEDWLDDLCVRFIINLPPEELESVERICFQVEEAQWFYEDFIRPLDPSLPSLPLRAFSLRIFQHCPLFSSWSAEHYTTAFAEFMAYKSRVPVRGAILLNDAMDECVLVKGWKKGANWSFPRGKINKDENDLDCAVREVYEETGFDLKAAGLVHDEKDMKYIEQTMREQHMKLFVFRGVPKDTHFEPRTRKEISKIEWYKLADLPTIKKHKHQDSSGGQHAGMSANKFYMVAPFLGHLKKWIVQQKKQKNRYSSNLAAPPIVAEDSEAELTPAPVEVHHQDPIPSDLPEVTISRSAEATAQLRQLFNIGQSEPPQPQTRQQPPSHMPDADMARSNALLALLRGGPSVELRAGPHTPLDQVSFPPNVPQSPHQSHVRSPPIHQPPPPQFMVQSELPTSPPPHRREPIRPPPGLERVSQPAPFQPIGNFLQQARIPPPPPPRAPYQQTGDPDFARPRPSSQALPAVPPASALPKLTNHTKALLDVFKGAPQPTPAPTLQQPIGVKQQSLLDIFKQPSPVATSPQPVDTKQQGLLDLLKQPTPVSSSKVSPLPSQTRDKPSLAAPLHPIRQPVNPSAHNLLSAFGQQSPRRGTPSVEMGKRVELSATPDHQHQPGDGGRDKLLSMLRQQNIEKAIQKPSAPVVKEGQTAATMSGPFNQPNFDAIARPQHKEVANGMGRSPLTTHRTLFDPNHPVPIKIMARPQTPKENQGKSPRTAKAKMATASPKRAAKPTVKDAEKPFHPQILKRPQTAEGEPKGAESQQRTAALPPTPISTAVESLPISRDASSEKYKAPAEGKPSQLDPQKQALLSILGGAPSPASKESQTPSRVVSPLSMSQVVSPKDEVPVSAIDGPISTRSRMGSLVSVSSVTAPTRPASEKKQTGAENKAWMLGYLGRMATNQG